MHILICKITIKRIETGFITSESVEEKKWDDKKNTQSIQNSALK